MAGLRAMALGHRHLIDDFRQRAHDQASTVNQAAVKSAPAVTDGENPPGAAPVLRSR
jgi:hypothetical protein